MNRSFVLHQATLYRENLSPYRVPYLGVENGVVSFLGEVNLRPDLPLRECGGAVIKPFCDYHYHLPGSRLYDLFGVNLTDLSPDCYESALKSAVEDFEIVRGFGWDVSSLSRFFSEDPRTPLSFLDGISPHRPVFLFSMDFHSCWCNSAALTLLEQEGISCEFADSEIRSGGECILHEGIAEQIFHCDRIRFSSEQIKQAVLLEQDYLLSLGITELFSLIFIGASFFQTLDVLRHLEEEGVLKIKICFSYTTSPRESLESLRENLQKCFAYESAHLRLASVKVYMDGVIDNHSAYLSEPYSDRPLRGEAIWKAEDLALRVQCAASFGLPMHAHAIGDGAVKLATEVFGEYPPTERGRHIIAHLQLCSEDSMVRMAERDIVACLQPFWFYRGASAVSLDQKRLGERADRMYPAASLLHHGVKILFASDSPATMDYDPFIGIRTACRPSDPENISFGEGLSAYTVGAYEDISPEIRVGDRASFLLLKGDLTSSRKPEVSAVYGDGELLWREESDC